MDLKENEDYYINADGLLVMTEAYHLKRGTCCGKKCKIYSENSDPAYCILQELFSQECN